MDGRTPGRYITLAARRNQRNKYNNFNIVCMHVLNIIIHFYKR